MPNLDSVPQALVGEVWLSHDSMWLLTTLTAAGVLQDSVNDTIFIDMAGNVKSWCWVEPVPC